MLTQLYASFSSISLIFASLQILVIMNFNKFSINPMIQMDCYALLISVQLS